MCVCICMVARVHVCVRVSVECKRAEGGVREEGQTILKEKTSKTQKILCWPHLRLTTL